MSGGGREMTGRGFGMLLVAALGMALLIGCGSDDSEAPTQPTTAAGLTQQGWAQFEAGNYSGARESFVAAIGLNASYGEAYNGRGWSAMKLRSYAEALGAFDGALEHGLGTADPLVGRAIVVRALEPESHQAVIDDASGALALDPDYHFAHDAEVDWQDVRLLMAHAFFGLQAYDQANAQVGMLGGNVQDPASPNFVRDLLMEIERLSDPIPTYPAFLLAWGSEGLGFGQFRRLGQIGVDGDGNVYVGDGDRVQKFDGGGNFITTWGRPGPDDGEFVEIRGIACDSEGYVYVVDGENGCVQKFDADGSFLARWDGDGTTAFARPTGIACDGAGYVYVVDAADDRVMKFDTEGTHVSDWGEPGAGAGQFAGAEGIACDGGGHVYVADTGNHRIQKFSTSGSFVLQWGRQGSGDGRFQAPGDVACDAGGYVYVADTGNHRFQKFDAQGRFVLRRGGQGTGNGYFKSPGGIACAAGGHVYVVDTGNYRVQKFR